MRAAVPGIEAAVDQQRPAVRLQHEAVLVGVAVAERAEAAALEAQHDVRLARGQVAVQRHPAGVGHMDRPRQLVRRRGGRGVRPGHAGAQLGQRVAARRVGVHLLGVPAVDRVGVRPRVQPHDLPVQRRGGRVRGVPEAGAGAPRRPEVQEVPAVVAAPRPVEVIGAGGHGEQVRHALEVVAVHVAEALPPAAVGAAVAGERVGEEPLDVGQPASRLRHVVVQRQRRHGHLRRPVDDAVAVQGIVEGVQHAVRVELAGARGEPRPRSAHGPRPVRPTGSPAPAPPTAPPRGTGACSGREVLCRSSPASCSIAAAA